MKKSDLVAIIAVNTGLSKKDSEKALTATLNAITDALKEGERVRLAGFGSFNVRERDARIGHNPKTREAIEIPASRTPQFKAGKTLKDAVSK